jgi:hypothetical protein
MRLVIFQAAGADLTLFTSSMVIESAENRIHGKRKLAQSCANSEERVGLALALNADAQYSPSPQITKTW